MHPRPIRVLFVDDNPADAQLVKEYLLETGVDVKITVVKDGQRAMDMFGQKNEPLEERPDLVLLDINMPGRNGYEVLNFIRQRDNETKVILFSGSRSLEDTRGAEIDNADGYIIKPMTIKEIDAVIKELRNILASLNVAQLSFRKKGTDARSI